MNALRAPVPLAGLDGVFLDLETPATPMHIGSLHLFARPKRAQPDFFLTVKRALASRLGATPILSRRLARVPLNLAHPAWREGGRVDLAYHVQRVRLPAPGTLAELEECVAALHAETMDRRRPLWRLYVLEGLADGRHAYFFKVHHAVLDGKSGAALAAALFDAAPQPRARAPRRGSTPPRTPSPDVLAVARSVFSHDAGQLFRLLRFLPTAARTLAGLIGRPGVRLRHNFAFGPRTPLNVTITSARSVAVRSVPLSGVKAIGARHDATINDVVLAICSGTLRRYLARHGGVPRKPLVAAMPISLRAPGDERFGTEATLSLVSLATNVADPMRRLRAVRAAAGAAKGLARNARSLIPTDFPSLGVPWILSSLAALYGASHVADVIPPIANLVISNVPGPPRPLYAAGSRMQQYWPLSIVEHGVGLNITVLSYAGTLCVGFTAARCAADAGEIAADFEQAYLELARSAAGRAARRR